MVDFTRVAILGASGQLGKELLGVFADCGPIALEHRMVDLEEPASLAHALRRHRPTLLINTAAYHNVDQCEAFPAKAFAVNTLGVDLLAGMCASAGVTFAHVSTDYVFAGDLGRAYTESDPAQPVNVYGASKLAGETLLGRHAQEHFIFRTSGLFGNAQSASKGLTFVERMLRAAKTGAPLRVVDDIVFSPSYTGHVAHAMRRILEKGEHGLYHVSNSGQCSWRELAVEAIRQAGLKANVDSVKADRSQLPRRPFYSALAHESITRAGVEGLPDWREGVAAYLRGRQGKTSA